MYQFLDPNYFYSHAAINNISVFNYTNFFKSFRFKKITLVGKYHLTFRKKFCLILLQK